LGIALSKIIQVAGMGWIDKLLGVFFGLARGLFVVCLIVMLAGLTSLPQHPAWRSALLSAPLEATVELILPWLPSSLAEKINFD
jgi:membrane protein required for colicin V production